MITTVLGHVTSVSPIFIYKANLNRERGLDETPAPESAPEIATMFWTHLHSTFWHLQHVISDLHRK